jgi:hypothetical protein
MTILFAKHEHTLQSRQTLSGVARQSQTIGVEYGLLWLTIEGRRQDFWLAAGDSMSLKPGRLVVIEAQADSRLWLQPYPKPGDLPRKTERSLPDRCKARPAST